MQDKFEYLDVRSEISRLLASLRQTVGVRFVSRSPEEFEDAQRFSMRIEGVRFLLNSLHEGHRRLGQGRDIKFLQEKIRRELNSLENCEELNTLGATPIKLLNGTQAGRGKLLLEENYQLSGQNIRT
ncbi:hypothetical protein J2858_002218 [Neorhizobium galegae]|uniref:hypothetical protein n=1 Tax=Neorhizobium galegae TaxID=399 RepID=UPI001AE2F3B8|nr:hypothetical protein [Neorhizobium galegae]MBP2549295.1 hypothetical protein [Neorhizobium galegae]